MPFAATLDLDHPDILKAILGRIVATGDVLRPIPGEGRTVLAVEVDDWLIDELAALGAADEDAEDEPAA